MDVIRKKIDSTIENLEEKKVILERHKSQYDDLKFKLMDYAQYQETDQPTIDVKLNSKAIVKGHVVNPQKILVFLGCEYFVERDPSKAVLLVENKLKYLKKSIKEFEVKIKEAKKTIENIGHLEEYEKKQGNQKKAVPKTESKKIEELDGEEPELPFMDIREELDEEGNVINSTIQEQDDTRIKDFGAENGINVDDNFEDELNELLQDMEIKPRPKIEEIPPSTENQNSKSAEADPADKIDNIPSNEIPSENKATQEKATIVEEPPKEEKPEKDDYYELLKLMGISDVGAKKKNKTEPAIPETSEKIIEPEVEPSKNPDSLPQESEFSYEAEGPAIDRDDILQLQLIADEIEEEGEDYDSEDLEDAFGNDEEDDDDDDDHDWDFTSNPDNLVPEAHRNLFMKELERVRAQKEALNTPVNTKDEPVTEAPKPKKKKSVTFAPQLQIKEIENVSEQLKNAPDIGNVSKFKQIRLSNNLDLINDDAEETESVEHALSNMIMGKNFSTSASNGNFKNVDALKDKPDERAVSDTIIEKDFPEPVMGSSIKESVVSDIVEKPEPEQPKQKVSRFKQRNNTSTGNNATPNIPKASNESPVGDIIEREANSVVSDIVEQEGDSALNDIVEREPATSKPKVSRFKSSKQSVKGNPISIPNVEPKYIPDESEYDKIKAYVENEEDDEDEEILNELTDFEIYTPADLEGNEEDEDEEDEDEDPNVLVDEIVENDEVDDPSYYVDENMLQKEYNDLRKKMMQKYLDNTGDQDTETIIHREEEASELEPIDENGNPIKVSRFRKSIGK